MYEVWRIQYQKPWSKYLLILSMSPLQVRSAEGFSLRGGLEKTEKVLSLEGMWFWWAWGKYRQRKYSTRSTDPFYANLGKREKIPTNHHQDVSFQVYLISTTPHPRLDLGGNKKWKGGRCSWQGGESRCALGRRGDHKYQQCVALSFARTRSILGPPCFISSGFTQTVGISLPYGRDFDLSDHTIEWTGAAATIFGQLLLLVVRLPSAILLSWVRCGYKDCLSISALLFTAP